MPARDSTERPDLLDRLRTRPMRVLGRMPWSSNATLLVELGDGDDPTGEDAAEERSREGIDPSDLAIYKPATGERPLWDFPSGLYQREAAAHVLAEALGWDLIPPTVVRDGPHGVGSVQQFVPADPEEHYFVLLERPELHDQLRRMAAFDLVANSTDRKAGHVLCDPRGHLWGIDNGLCLHAEFKLRTVIWDFADEPLPSEIADDLDRFVRSDPPSTLVESLDPFEIDALFTRARALLSAGRLPTDPTGRRYPWPLI